MTLDNIPMIFNNQDLSRLKKEAEEIENQYWNKKEELRNKKNDKELKQEVEKLDTKRIELQNSIYEIEKNLIDLQSSFVKISSEETLSRRQIYAQRCLEQGDIESAKEALEFDTIKKEADKILDLQNIKKEELKIKVNELLQRAETLKLDSKNDNRLEEIEKSYQEAIRIEKEGGLYREALLKYSNYLNDHGDYEKTIETTKKFVSYIEVEELDVTSDDMLLAYVILYRANCQLQNYKDAESVALKAIEIVEKGKDPEEMAYMYTLVAEDVYKDSKQYEKEIEYLEKAVEIYKTKVKANIELSSCYSDISKAYQEQKKYDLSIQYGKYAVKYAKSEYEKNENDTENTYWLSSMHYRLYHVYYSAKKYEEAYDEFTESVKLISKLVLINPKEFVDISDIRTYEFINFLNNVIPKVLFSKSARNVYRKLKANSKQADNALKLLAEVDMFLLAIPDFDKNTNFEEALKKFKNVEKTTQDLEKAVESDAENIKKEERFKYIDAYSRTYAVAGIIYENLNQSAKAEEYYKKAIRGFEKLKDENEYSNFSLVQAYFNIATFYHKKGKKYDLAEEYYKKAIDIGENITKEETLSLIFYSLAYLYFEEKDYEKAIEYYEKAIDITEKLAKENPNGFNETLSILYHNIADSYSNLSKKEETIKYNEKGIRIKEELAKEAPKKYKPKLSTSYNQIAIVYEKMKEFDKAEEYYKKAIDYKEEVVKDVPNEELPKVEKGLENLIEKLTGQRKEKNLTKSDYEVVKRLEDIYFHRY